jgi:hypothetical protein
MRRPSYNSNDNGSTKSSGLQAKTGVRFAETCEGTVVTKSFATPHSFDKKLWLNKEECVDVRRQGQKVIDSIQTGDFSMSQARKHSYIKTMTRVWKSCAKGKDLSASTKKELCFWTSLGHSRRGLEKFCLSDVQSARRKLRHEHREGVLFVQDQCWENEMDYGSSSRLLRVASEWLSKAALHYASTLAEADAYAVENDVKEEMAHTMVKKLSDKFDVSERLPPPPPREPRGKSRYQHSRLDCFVES